MDTAGIAAISVVLVAMVILLGLVLYSVAAGCAVKSKPSREQETPHVVDDGHAQSPFMETEKHGIVNPGMQEEGT